MSDERFISNGEIVAPGSPEIGPANGQPTAPTADTTTLLRAFAGLSEQFETKLAIDTVKDSQIKQLHAELLEHRKGMIQSAIQPLVLEVIRMRDDITKRTEAVRAKSMAQAELLPVVRELEGVREDLLLILEGAGVLPYEEPQSGFNAGRQQSVLTVKTDDNDRHGKISHRVNPGYEMAGRTLIKERVRVYVYEKPSTVPETNSVGPVRPPVVNTPEKVAELAVPDPVGESAVAVSTSEQSNELVRLEPAAKSE